MLADTLPPSLSGAVQQGARAALRELEASGLLAAAAWSLYHRLDDAPDFPVIKIRWGFLRFTVTKEQCEPALRWLLTRLVGPEPT